MIKTLTKEFLEEEYRTKSVCDIAKKYEISQTQMYRIFEKYGIKRRHINIIYNSKHGKCSRINRKKCIDCGNELSTNLNAKRCLRCSNIFRWKNKKYRTKTIQSITKEWSARKLKPKTCMGCGAVVGDRRSVYCVKCMQLIRYYNRKIYYCKDCGKTIAPGNAGRCRSCCKKGKRNNAYVHGNDTRKYKNIFINIISKQIRQRDDFMCQICHNRGYDVHHIDYNKDNNRQKNLITLCRSCHAKTNFNRRKWSKYLRRMIK